MSQVRGMTHIAFDVVSARSSYLIVESAGLGHAGQRGPSHADVLEDLVDHEEEEQTVATEADARQGDEGHLGNGRSRSHPGNDDCSRGHALSKLWRTIVGGVLPEPRLIDQTWGQFHRIRNGEQELTANWSTKTLR